MIGGFIFILIQLVLIIDFGHSLNESWVAKYEETENKCYYALLIGTTFLGYGVSIAGKSSIEISRYCACDTVHVQLLYIAVESLITVRDMDRVCILS